MNRRCVLFHRYGKWSEAFNSTAVRSRGSFGDTSTDDVVIQQRTCVRCGFVKVRVVRDGKTEDRYGKL